MEVQALFDYSRQHFDELSFKTGDTIRVLKEIEGGWWLGELNNTKGWFPSNYVRQILPSPKSADTNHLLSFQQEIVQHILEGESKQISDLNMLIRVLQPNVDTLSQFTFMSKLSVFLDKVVQIIRLHESIVKALEKMKPLSKPKFVGKLFLDVAKSMDQLTGEYTRSCAYIEAGLQENSASIPAAIGAAGRELYSQKTKSLFSSVHDRLSRYPILLKETERYYEEPHPDRTAICKAMQVYSEILDRCNLLRSLRETDIEVLSSEIRGLPDQSRLQFSDPTLTLKAQICTVEADGTFVVDSSKPHEVLLLYPSFLIFLSACPDSPKVYQFQMHVPMPNIAVTAPPTNNSVITIKILGGTSSAEERNINLSCTGPCTRDLFFSTVTEFIRNSKWELEAVKFRHPLPLNASSQASAHRTVSESDHRSQAPPTSGSKTSAPPTAEGGGPSRQRSATRVPKPSHVRRSGSCRSTGGGGGGGGGLEDDSASCLASNPPHLFALRPSYSGPLCGPSAEAFEEAPASRLAASQPPRTNTVAVTDITNLPGCRFLPHTVRARPLVKWPEDIVSLSNRQSTEGGSAFGSPGVSPLGGGAPASANLTHLRLDCTPPQSQCLVAGDAAAAPHGLRSSARPLGGLGNRSSRPNSPGRPGPGGDGSAASASAGKVMRRKRTDRQKSAINVDDVIRSTGRIHEITQRNEGDAQILQIIELYCASSLPKGVHKPLDLTQLRLSSTEMRLKENSQPPGLAVSTAGGSLSTSCRTYENLDPSSLGLLRPPPVILPTSASSRKT